MGITVGGVVVLFWALSRAQSVGSMGSMGSVGSVGRCPRARDRRDERDERDERDKGVDSVRSRRRFFTNVQNDTLGACGALVRNNAPQNSQNSQNSPTPQNKDHPALHRVVLSIVGSRGA